MTRTSRFAGPTEVVERMTVLVVWNCSSTITFHKFQLQPTWRCFGDYINACLIGIEDNNSIRRERRKVIRRLAMYNSRRSRIQSCAEIRKRFFIELIFKKIQFLKQNVSN
jgi:hypothetical protein